MVQEITFRDRAPSILEINIGNKNDNNVNGILFRVPFFSETQINALKIKNGVGDIILFGNDGLVSITRTQTYKAGRFIGYIEITEASGDVVWSSNPFALIVKNTPEIDGQIEAANPTWLVQTLDAVQETAANLTSSNAVKADIVQLKTDILSIKSNTEDYKNLAVAAASSAEASKNSAASSAATAEQKAVQAGNVLLNGVATHNTSTSAHQDLRDAIDDNTALAMGASVSETYADIQSMVTALNAMSNTAMCKGRNINIVTVGVPDLWVAYVEVNPVTYAYISDTAFVSALETTGTVQVGYYKLAMLETQKVDLTDYATKLYVQLMLPIKITQSEYDDLVAAGTVEADRIYYVV